MGRRELANCVGLCCFIFVQSSVSIIPVCSDEETEAPRRQRLSLWCRGGQTFPRRGQVVNISGFGGRTSGSGLSNSATVAEK